ncbi:MAG TPA: hypothetical protein ENG45_01955 [Candidatus Aenigmarchaeota archaeon]|nr:hypothetical protein [Candidatus Aenigmarchaeota archaeon]
MIKAEGAKVKYIYSIINGIAAKVPANAIERIATKPFVELIEPDYEIKLVLDDSVPQINADKVWSVGITGKGVDVAILDTGIHDEHPALEVLKEVDFTGEGTDDLHGHGTHVAGIVASKDLTYRGVAFDANLLNVKVLNKDGIGYASDVIKGIEWAVENGAEILSMSFGAEVEPCDGTDAISRAVDNAVKKGVIAVVAAGNGGPSSGTITSPGCAKEAITVGAIDDNDKVPSWSSRGPTDDGRVKPDLVAPGVGIISTWKDNSFKSLSGTSMSTPHVSGVVALLLEAKPELKPDEVKEILKSTAVDLGYDENTQGAGKVDTYEAYLYIMNISEEKVRPRLILGRELPAAGIMPDSPLYVFKKLFEKLDLFLTFEEVAKAEKHLKYAEVRLAEAREMIEKGKTEYVDELLEEYEDNLEMANQIAKVAQKLGKNVSKVVELVAIATTMHLDVLEGVYEKVPEQAKPAIEKAMNFSKKGNKEALNVLKNVLPERAAEVNFFIAEKILAKALEKANKGDVDNIDELMKEYSLRVNESSEFVKIAKSLGKNVTNVEKLVERTTLIHTAILENVYEKVPEQAKQAVIKALNVSTKGREITTTILKKEIKKELIKEQTPIPEEEEETKVEIPVIEKEVEKQIPKQSTEAPTTIINKIPVRG